MLPCSGAKTTYWWTEEIADLRRQAVHQARKVARSRGNIAGSAEALEISLKLAIKKEKAKAWELFQTLEEDPWGRPCKIIFNKLRWALPLTKSLDPGFVREVIDTLFPRMDGEEAPPGPLEDHDLEVGVQELHQKRAKTSPRILMASIRRS